MFEEREITYNGTTFYIGKMLGQDAKELFVFHLLPCLSGAVNVPSGGGVTEMAIGFLSGIPREHYQPLVNKLYEHIDFTREDRPTRIKVAKDRDSAFKDLEAAHILMLEARALAVNFSKSWDVVSSEFPRLNLIMQQLASSTLTPSSETPSAPNLPNTDN